MKARPTPRTAVMVFRIFCTLVRRILGSSPKTLMTIWPSICEMLSSTLSRMGMETLGNTPGIESSSSLICSTSCSRVILRVHCSGGLTPTNISTMLSVLGSVPSSGRPAWLMTVSTSGNLRIMPRTLRANLVVSTIEVPGDMVMLTHIVPSFNSGRNSEPSRGTSVRLKISDATAAASTV